MIGVLLVSHGKMADGIKDSANMIVGDSPQFEALELAPDQDIETLKNSVLQHSKSLDVGKGVLVFVDIYGASPYNASMQCVPEWQSLAKSVRVITGMNLPMVITALMNREGSSLPALIEEVISEGVDSIQDAMIVLKSAPTITEEDDY